MQNVLKPSVTKNVPLLWRIGVTLLATLVATLTFSADAVSAAAEEEEEAIEEIIVYGTRSSVEQSLATQKDKDNISTVLAADLSGRFPDSTLAETMRRAPAISFQRAERGGEGQYVSIRGLDAALNNVKINGITTGGASFQRRASFDFLQADMLSEIVINKSLLPEHDGEGIGGAIELNVRSPLTYRKDQTAFKLEARHGEFRDKTGPVGSFSFNRHLGEDWAISGYLNSRKRYVESHFYDVEGDHVPGRIDFAIDPLDTDDLIDRAGGSHTEEWAIALGPDFTAGDFPDGRHGMKIEDYKYNFIREDKTDRTATLNVGWRATDRTEVLMALTYAESDRENLRQSLGFYQSDGYSVPSGCYLCDGDPYPGTQNFEGTGPLTGAYAATSPQFQIKGEVADSYRDSFSSAFKITSDISDSLTATYGFGYTSETYDRPFEIDLNYRIDDIQKASPSQFGGETLLVARGEKNGDYFIDYDQSGGDYNIPIPLLTDAGYAALVDPDLPEFYYAGMDPLGTKQYSDRYVAYVDLEKQFFGSGMITDIKFGFKAERSTFEYRDPDTDTVYGTCCLPDGTAGMGDNGDPNTKYGDNGHHRLGDTNLVKDKLYNLGDTRLPIPRITHMMDFSRSAILAFGKQFERTFDFEGNVDNKEMDTEEDILAAYFQLGLDVTDEVHVIAGARLEHVKVDVHWQDNNVGGELLERGAPEDYQTDESGGYTDFLPRLQVIYRPSDFRQIVVRGALATSVARPSLFDMGYSAVSIAAVRDEETGLETDERSVNVTIANPDLDSSYAYNADLMFEYYTLNNGIFGAGIYYKKINDFIFQYSSSSNNAGTTGSLDDIPGYSNFDLTGLDANFSTRQNGNSAYIRGIELNAIYSFEDILPGIWSGLGVYANLTFQRTQTEVVVTESPFRYERSTDFFNSPRKIANAAITYEKHGIDATLSYSYQDWQIDTIEDFMNQDEWEASYYSIDLNVQYTLPVDYLDGEYLVFVQLSDLTNNGDRAINQEMHGRHRNYIDDVEFIGRQFVVGVRARF